VNTIVVVYALGQRNPLTYWHERVPVCPNTLTYLYKPVVVCPNALTYSYKQLLVCLNTLTVSMKLDLACSIETKNRHQLKVDNGFSFCLYLSLFTFPTVRRSQSVRRMFLFSIWLVLRLFELLRLRRRFLLLHCE